MKKASIIMISITVIFIVAIAGLFIGRITTDGFIHVYTSDSIKLERNLEDGYNSSGKININTADENLLKELPGIGPKTAKAIVEYREKHGPFETIREIKEVEGIGVKTYDKIKLFITVQEE